MVRSVRRKVRRSCLNADISQPLMSRTLIIVGLVVVAIGLLWPWLSKLGFGRLPGDIVLRSGNITFYFPLVTCLLISIALSLLLWLMRR